MIPGLSIKKASKNADLTAFLSTYDDLLCYNRRGLREPAGCRGWRSSRIKGVTGRLWAYYSVGFREMRIY